MAKLKASASKPGYWKRSTALRKYLLQHIGFTIVLSVTLILTAFLLIGSVVPFPQTFEGSVLVKGLSFVCDRPSTGGELLLTSIEGIKQLVITGKQQLAFEGGITFQEQPAKGQASETPSTLNQPLEVELENEGQVVIRSLNPASSDLILSELRVQQGTQVTELKYDPSDRRRLLMTLEPASEGNQQELGVLRFTPNSAVEVELQGYRLLSPKTNISPKFTLSQAPEHIWQFRSSLVGIRIELPEDEQQIFGRDIIVRDVALTEKLPQSSSSGDTVKDSTIKSGTIRIGERTVALEESQFLDWTSNGNETLRRIQVLHPGPEKETQKQSVDQATQEKEAESPKGLKVDVSGQTTQLTVGLNPKLPIVKVSGNLLSNLPNDVKTGLISFDVALVLGLVAWLLDNFSETESKP